MKYSNKLKWYNFILNLVRSNILYAVVMLVILVVINFFFSKQRFDPSELLDIKIVSSIFLTLIVSSLTNKLIESISIKTEDHTKLNTNYQIVISKYPKCENMITYTNSAVSDYIKGRKYTSVNRTKKKVEDNKDEYIFPVTIEKYCYGVEFLIDDNKKGYVLPEIVEKNYDSIMNAHKYSNVYNQLNIRLDDYSIDGNKVTLHTSRTTYFESLVTNRAMDYKWSSNSTVRELLSPGPFFEELKDSQLSNHLGVNGFIETADGKFVFVFRSKNLSIAKEMLGTSVGASIKTKYALDSGQELKCEGLENAIASEIHDELNLDKKCFEFSLDKNIIALYRDLVEGGKPQLLFYVKVGIDSGELRELFYKASKESKKSKNSSLRMDGKKIVLVDRNEIEKIYITPDYVTIGRKVYRTMPSSSASIVMLIEHLRQNKQM